MKRIILTLCLLSITSFGFCDVITADADGYGNGSVISTAFEGMTLGSAGGYSGLDGMVYAWEDGLASTGSSVFANNLISQLYQLQQSVYNSNNKEGI